MATKEQVLQELARRELQRRQQTQQQLQPGGQDGVARYINGADVGGAGDTSRILGIPTGDILSAGRTAFEAISPIPTPSEVQGLAPFISGAVAEPIAGLAGIAQSINPFAEQGAGARAVEQVRGALTVQPTTKRGMEKAESAAKAIEPIARGLEAAETFLGDEAFEATGSPALAAAATSIPTAMLEVLGVASMKGTVKGAGRAKELADTAYARRAKVEAAPTIEQLKDTSRAVYKELDQSGVMLREKPYRGLMNKINNEMKAGGFDKDLAPKTAAVLRRLQEEAGKPLSLTEVDNLRKLSQNAASALEPADARLGGIIVEHIDDFLDRVTPTAFESGKVATSEIGPKYRIARELWGRARRSELINDAFEKAKNQASGFENGIVTQFRSILNNKKKARFFRPQEVSAMQDVVRGTTPTNIAKLIGRLGFSEGHATNIIGGSLGVAGGAAIAGAPGAVAVPLIGQMSRKLAQRLTRKGAEFADIVVRAGNDADRISKAYLQKTPRNMRSSAELSELLMRKDIALDKLLGGKDGFLREAAEIAQGNRSLISAQAIPGAVQQARQEER